MKYLKLFNSISARNSYLKNNFYTPRIYHVTKQPIFYEEKYLELEYISSTTTGGQYIDLGCKLLENTDDIEIDIKFNHHGEGKHVSDSNGNKQWTILGNQKESSPYTGFVLRHFSDSSNALCEFMAKWQFSNSINNGTNYYANAMGGNKVSSDYSWAYCDVIHSIKVTLNNIPAAQCHNLNTMLFCGLDSNGNPWRFSCADIYHLKITKGGQIIRDLIPVIKVNTHEVGLYDKENHVFYKSQSNESFVPHYKVAIYKNIYKKVEYISSTSKGAQYFDLDCKLMENTNDIRIDIKFMIDAIGYGVKQVSDYATLLSCEQDSDPWYGVTLRKLSGTNPGCGEYYDGIAMCAKWEPLQNFIDVEYKNCYYATNLNGYFQSDIYGVTKTKELYEKTFILDNIQSEYCHNFTTTLFCVLHNDQLEQFSRSKLYYLKLTKGGQVIRDLIPVERITDNKLGLYDIQNDVFYEPLYGRSDIYESLLHGEYIN